MLLPMRLRLSLSYLGVLVLGMSLAAALAWLAVESLFLSTQRENLLAQARLTAAALQDASLPNQSTQTYSQVLNVQPGLHMRLLSESGAVLVGLPIVDVPQQAPPAENAVSISPAELLARPEIRQALDGQPATAVRTVPPAGGRRVLYAAAPVLAEDGSLAGIIYLAAPLPPSGLPANVALQFAGALLLAVVLAGLAGTLLARRLARPLEDLARAAGAVAAGDLDRQVPVGSDMREMHSLGQTFNAMTASLRRSDQTRSAFIADVAHELRTPLTVIKGTIETLEDGALDDTAGRGPLLTSMQGETDRLIRMVNGLLVLTRAEAGGLKLRLETLDLGELARLRCSHLASLAADRRVELRVADEAADQSCISGDADRLAQVLDNLLDNAIRYAPEGTTVTVTIRRAGGWVECTVSDHGPGIPAQHLPFIFERFYRADASRDRHTGGAGLGLAIARALVQAHGGEIAAASREGEGTAVTFRLPCAGTDTELPGS
jgi:signal transduction histidine kinase